MNEKGRSECFVVKSNELVQRRRYSLSAQQQKMILFIISKIKKDDDDSKFYEFTIKEFCAACGIVYGGGKTYEEVRAAVKELGGDKNSFDYRTIRGEDTSVKWIQKWYTDKTTGMIRVQLDADLKPHLLNLKERFVKFMLADCLAMSSRYAIRIYELLKSYQYMGEITYNLDEFKKTVDAEKYKVYADFRVNVIEVALREIDTYTDLEVIFTPIKTGKAVTALKFSIKQKSDFGDRLLAWHNRDKKLDPKASTLLEQVEEIGQKHV